MEHDFDFIFGTWDIHNRKRRDTADPSCDDSVEFATTSRTEPILAGLSHVERIHAGPGSPGGPWEGMTLRQFDPHDAVWRIWWASTQRPGRLDPPLSGRFTDGIEGVHRPGRPRRHTGRPPVHLDQPGARPGPVDPGALGDAGRTWRLDWVMDFNRSNADD